MKYYLINIYDKTSINMIFKLTILLLMNYYICDAKYTRISSKPSDIVFQYRDGAPGEKSLDECKKNEACSVIYKRFWMPNLSQRLCRCYDGIECPWSTKNDNQSMSLNNRSLLKFCEPINHKKTCKSHQIAAIVNGIIDDEQTNIIVESVKIDCSCPKSHYWKISEYSYIDNKLYQVFKCAKQRKCLSYEFCGFVRADFYSIYYRCLCPAGNICITKYEKSENIQELMYLGEGYEAFCEPWNSTSIFD
ncbi:kappa-scoloptoxin(11)-Ss1a-like [Aphidius gifuensis]|uniref:kappa-scoloptoxin(11)-Ss1a-like n=1 Tax=Aphidius gifuensis TaxID=684658 RepID=UPI001CDBF3F2|nr:kappa-scoloptoxin(11)-Ss1a-like [Aphidius gifuensis]